MMDRRLAQDDPFGFVNFGVYDDGLQLEKRSLTPHSNDARDLNGHPMIKRTPAPNHSEATVDPSLLGIDVSVADAVARDQISGDGIGEYDLTHEQAVFHRGYQFPEDGFFPTVDGTIGGFDTTDGDDFRETFDEASLGKKKSVETPKGQRSNNDANDRAGQENTAFRMEGAALAEAVAAELVRNDRSILSFPEGDFELTLGKSTAAHAFIHARKPLTLSNDDWIAVELNTASHVRRILRALTSLAYISADDEKAKTKQELSQRESDSWLKWQTDHVKKVHRILSVPLIQTEVEARAFLLFDQILKPHKHGVRSLVVRTDTTLTCSQRLTAVLQAIEDYPIVRTDVLDELPALEALAADPFHFCQLKKTYRLNNLKRSENGGAGDASTKATVISTTAEVAAFTHGSWKIRFSAEEIAGIKAMQKSHAKRKRGKDTRLPNVEKGSLDAVRTTGDDRSEKFDRGLLGQPSPRDPINTTPTDSREVKHVPSSGGMATRSQRRKNR